MTRNSFGFPTGSIEASFVSGPAPALLVPRIGDPIDQLPPTAAERLRELRQQRDDAHVLIMSAVEETQSLRVEIQGHRNRMRQLREPRGSGGYNLSDDDPRVAGEQAKLDKRTIELKRRAELSDLRGEHWRTLSTLVRNAEDWIRNIPSGTAIAMHAPVDAELKKGEDLLTCIERYRRRGRELQADLLRVRASPWPSAGVKKKARELVDPLAEAGAPRADHAIEHGGPISFPTRTYHVRIFNADPSAIGFVEIPDPVALLAWLLPDALLTAIDREIDAVADDENAF